jgi:glutamate dehydrogenase/leucine dehydrogenase
MPGVRIHKLDGTDAFIVFDLDDAPHSIGITRVAPKILVDGATMLARSNTYLFASFEQQAGGASAGINAKPEDRDAAIAAFVAEVEPMVREGAFLTEAGKGLTNAELAPLFAVDPRPDFDPAAGVSLLGATVAVCAEKALGASGALSGATVAIEGLDAPNVSVVQAMADHGARIVAIATTKGAVSNEGGFDPAAVIAAVESAGPAAVDELGGEVKPAWSVFAAPADVLCAGSKVGAVSDEGASSITAKVVVPIGPLAVTAKALAMLRRSGSVVLPDFLAISGPMFASFHDEGATLDDVRGVAREQVGAVLDEVLGHEDGPLLGACYRAEAFLRTWRETLPFGRPLA